MTLIVHGIFRQWVAAMRVTTRLSGPSFAQSVVDAAPRRSDFLDCVGAVPDNRFPWEPTNPT